MGGPEGLRVVFFDCLPFAARLPLSFLSLLPLVSLSLSLLYLAYVVEGSSLRVTEQTVHLVYISLFLLAGRGAILRLDLILRDHYVGRHRQVLRDVLVLTGVVAVALRVFPLVRLILLRLLLHRTVRHLAFY